ncbi:MAG: hypothetical protein ACI4VQ_08010 [Clostridia bacterium]
MKYFCFKKLNKRRRIDFIIFFVLGLFFMISSIKTLNIWQGLFGFIVLIESIDIFNDQSNENIINNYQETIESFNNTFKCVLTTIRDLIKENDEKKIQEFTSIIENFIEEDNYNDIKQ